jgi:hypothetical protein
MRRMSEFWIKRVKRDISEPSQFGYMSGRSESDPNKTAMKTMTTMK